MIPTFYLQILGATITTGRQMEITTYIRLGLVPSKKKISIVFVGTFAFIAEGLKKQKTSKTSRNKAQNRDAQNRDINST